MVRVALRSLRAHRLRSALSALGVVFAVAAVVATTSVGEGARRETLAQIEALGIDTVTARRPAGAARDLPLAAAESLRHVVPGVTVAAPVRVVATTADADGRTAPLVALGTTPAYRAATRLDVAAGRFLADLDVREAGRVAVLGAAVARSLFPARSPLGASVRLDGEWFTVVGVLESRASPRGRGGVVQARDPNRVVLVPLPALDRGAGSREGVDEIVLRFASAEAASAGAAAARAVLDRVAGGPLELVVPREIQRQRDRSRRVFDIVTAALAAIGLLVGGIGIMNVMLASVAERTREVGVRRAIGARRRDVATQFLLESALLSTGGGALGALLGVASSWLVQRMAGWPTATHPGMVLAALGVALAVGVGFGFYPAWQASALPPTEALRRQ